MSDVARQRAMILAAGLGSRLRPVTDHLPKPLLPILGRPLLDIIVANLRTAGVAEIALNTHHLADQIQQWVASRVQEISLEVFHEPEILGTGGGVSNARTFLEQGESFILHNGDVLTDLDLAELVGEHRRHRPVATLALVDWAPVNSVLLAPTGEIAAVVRPLPGSPHLAVSRESRAAPDTGTAGRWLTYTGVAVCSREIFRYLPATGFSSLVDALLAAMAARTGAVRGWAPEAVYWNDLGTVGRYLAAHRHILVENRLRPLPGIPAPRHGNRGDSGDTCTCDRSASDKRHRGAVFHAGPSAVAPDAQLEGFVALGRDCRVEPGARVEDSVVLDGAVVTGHDRRYREVIGRGWIAVAEPEAAAEVTVEETAVSTGESPLEITRESAAGPPVPPQMTAFLQASGFGPDTEARPITGHGSDRAFWHLAEGPRTAVLMQSPPEDPEFSRFLAIGAFLHEEDLGGPTILAADTDAYCVILEDLGEDSLYRLASAAGLTVEATGSDTGATGTASETFVPPANRTGTTSSLIDPAITLQRLTAIYRQALDLLVELQTRGTAALVRCAVASDRRFDYETLRWETDYFRHRFLCELAGVTEAEARPLDGEFHRLAEATLTQPQVLMHRDFQSQNIFFQEARVRLVDFQGMRLGPVAYDPMSLLRDAYVDLSAKLRGELREYYRARLASRGGPDLSAHQLRSMATVAGLQRNMQALGAFGYLSLVKGKSHFQRHIPLGLKHLAEGLAELGTAEGPGRLDRLAEIIERVTPRFPAPLL